MSTVHHSSGRRVLGTQVAYNGNLPALKRLFKLTVLIIRVYDTYLGQRPNLPVCKDSRRIQVPKFFSNLCWRMTFGYAHEGDKVT